MGFKFLDENAEEIARQNDAVRAYLVVGSILYNGMFAVALEEKIIQARVVITRGLVEDYGWSLIFDFLRAVERFDAFSEDNNPRGERDFGIIELKGRKIYWKIDYYDTNVEFLSPDPADPDKTVRVITLLRPADY